MSDYVFKSNRRLFAGKSRKAGDPVPDGYHPRRYETWESAGIIKRVAPQRQLPTEPPPQPASAVSVPEQPETVPEQPETVPEQPETVPEQPETVPEQPETVPEQPDASVTATPVTLEHTGAGWFNVVADGIGAVNESKLKGEDAAREWAETNGYKPVENK